MAVPKITLYLDIVSPFAYLAFHILRNSPTFAGCEINYVPIFLGGLMNDCGNTAPISIKNKDKWILTERLRWAQYFSVPVIDHHPEGYPPNTLATQRALCAVAQKFPEKLVSVIDALFRKIWIEDHGKIGHPEVFSVALEDVLGKKETQEILTAMSQPPAKALLASNTKRAFNAGAFGIPWFECVNSAGNTECFWGIDHLGQVTDFLGLDRKLDKGFRAVL